MKTAFLVVGAALSVGACFAITDDVSGLHGSTGTTDGVTPHDSDDLAMSFFEMYMHEGQRLEVRVVGVGNSVQSQAIIEPLKMTKGEFKISIPQAVPRGGGPYRIDIWADWIANGKYDFVKGVENYQKQDHSWRISLDDTTASDPNKVVTHSGGVYSVGLKHALAFTDISQFPDPGPPVPEGGTGVDARIRFTNLTPDHLAQVRVADSTGHVVGLYRFRTSNPHKDLVIPNCVEANTPYDVDLYVDANDNNDANGNGYDDPSNGGSDLGWRVHGTSGDKELQVTFDADPMTGTGHVNVGRP